MTAEAPRETAEAPPESPRPAAGAVARLDRLARAVGRGLFAGVAATTAITASSTAEMKLRGRPPSPAPAKVAARLLGVRPRGRGGAVRFATAAHVTAGISLGAARGVLQAAGMRGPKLEAAWLALAWLPDLVLVPVAGAAAPPWRWGAQETAISALHHAVYAAAASAAYEGLRRAGELDS